MPIIGIPESGRTRVYRKIVAQLRTDPVLEAAGIDWIPWDGSTKHVNPLTVRRPTIGLHPSLGPMRITSEDAQTGDMEIVVRMCLPGSFDACDCLDLWTAIEQAMYPFNEREKQMAFQASLVNCSGAGSDAEIGFVRFDRPASIEAQFQDGAFAQFVCNGSMSISIQRSINP